MTIEGSADPEQAAQRILDVAAECNVAPTEAATLIEIIANGGVDPLPTRNFPINRERTRDRARVAHEIAMHIGYGGAGTPARDLVAAVQRRARAKVGFPARARRRPQGPSGAGPTYSTR
ncbi:hypothetical protein [Prauserella muralis]|uniref:Uncharacterized protein n=1 Tax=Prauserella muralis TaxID=588067 RepID=A0A2V4ABX3_9PSEU|nr:hypothetical protein [Prauserella muralis]PXY16612.1 hypothetical protein BAY60_36085 [Prauserella muralis]TWE11139.1 hypothetical protein FHX69_7358 [Prauserella muralis]